MNKVMKENIPEKIYLFENPISGTPDDRWLSKRSDDDDIEYTRKDAFIEKGVEWLNAHTTDNEKGLIGDFIKYMEDEL